MGGSVPVGTLETFAQGKGEAGKRTGGGGIEIVSVSQSVGSVQPGHQHVAGARTQPGGEPVIDFGRGERPFEVSEAGVGA